MLYYNKGLYEEAVSAFMRALELDPKMQVAQRNLEIAYFNTGYYDKRVSRARASGCARARRPRRALGARPHVRAARADGRGGGGSSRELLRHHPNDIGALVQLGLAEQHQR